MALILDILAPFMTGGVDMVADLLTVTHFIGNITLTSTSDSPREIPDYIRALSRELRSFSSTLHNLQIYGQIVQWNSELKLIQTLNGTLLKCFQDMKAVLEKLGSGETNANTRFKRLSSLYWNLTEQETMFYISQIQRLQGLFLLAMVSSHVSQLRAIDTHSQETKPGARNTDSDAFGGEKKEVISSTYPGEVRTSHAWISSSRGKSTCRWILEAPVFQDWINGSANSRLLLGYGMPGSGKTFTCSFIIDHLMGQAEANNYGVAYIYFNCIAQELQRPVHILTSLLEQLASQMPHLPQHVRVLYNEVQCRNKAPVLEDVYGILLKAANLFTRTFFIFDALDECQKIEQRRALLPLFHQMTNDGISLLLTSREDVQDLQISFENSAKIEISVKDEEIVPYIEQKIDEINQAWHPIIQGDFRDRMVSCLNNISRGSFLLVDLHTKYLCWQATSEQMLMAAESLQNSYATGNPLEYINDGVTKDLRSQFQSLSDLAIKILSWVFVARRTLTVHELKTAVSVERNLYRLDETSLLDKTFLPRACGNLIIISQADTVSLKFPFPQVYLLSLINRRNANLKFATACITFFLYNIFSQGACDSDSSFYDRCRLYPFIHYAAQNLSFHLKRCSEDLSKGFVLRFLKSPGSMSSYWQALCSSSKHYWDTQFPKVHVSLHIAAALGHCSAVRHFFEGTEATALEDMGWKLISIASFGGHEAVIKLLLERGIDISVIGIDGMTVLHSAAASGNQSAILLLLKNNADISARNNEGLTALHLAANGGHELAASTLIEKGAGISLADDRGETALHKAAIAGHESTVLLLLVKGANAGTVNYAGKKAIQLAKERKHASVVQLLEKGLCAIYKLKTTFYDDYVVHTIYREQADHFQVKETWRRKKEIGSGGFANVYLEEEKIGGRVRAVKVLPRAKNKRYARELNALAQLIDHPDLFVQFLGWYENNDSIFIAMEYIEHGDLARYIKVENNKAKLNAKTIASQILNGLVFLHSKNICHRDLKPQNVLVARLEPLWVKITDFGISKSDENLSTRGAGTYQYMAPEMHGVLPKCYQSGSQYTKMVDLWAFGCLVHEILTSETPFSRRPSFETARESAYVPSYSCCTHSMSNWGDPVPEVDIELLMNYCNTHDFPDDLLKELEVDEEGIRFVKGFLAVDPKLRMSALDGLESPWLKSVNEITTTDIP